MEDLTVCHACGGRVRRKAEPGRTRSYRGQAGFEIPADLALMTCDDCGKRWLNEDDTQRLSAALRAQWIARKVSELGASNAKVCVGIAHMLTALAERFHSATSAAVPPGRPSEIALSDTIRRIRQHAIRPMVVYYSAPTDAILHVAEPAPAKPSRRLRGTDISGSQDGLDAIMRQEYPA